MRRWLLAGALALASLNAGQAAEIGPLPGYVAVPLRRWDNVLIVEATLNGHELSLQLDTGAPVTAISEAAYAKCVPRGAEANVPEDLPRHLFANGQKAFTGWLQDLRAGPMNFGSGPVAVTTLASLRREQYESERGRRRIEGLLGADVLSRYGAIIDAARLTVYFNVDPNRRAHLGAALARKGWTPVAMAMSSGEHYSVPTVIRGAAFHLIVDTGANVTALDSGRLARLKMVGARVAGRGQIVNMPASAVKALLLKNWKIGAYTIGSAPVGLISLPPFFLKETSGGGGPMLGLLGTDTFMRHQAVIDLGGMTLFLRGR